MANYKYPIFFYLLIDLIRIFAFVKFNRFKIKYEYNKSFRQRI